MKYFKIYFLLYYNVWSFYYTNKNVSYLSPHYLYLNFKSNKFIHFFLNQLNWKKKLLGRDLLLITSVRKFFPRIRPRKASMLGSQCD